MATGAQTQATVALAQDSVAPSQATVTPTQATGATTQATGTPAQATVTPTQATGTPTQATLTPTQATVTPAQATLTPTQATLTPAQATVTPSQAPHLIRGPREVELGTARVTFPSEYLQELTDCNHLLGDRDGLLRELNDKGYLFVRGLHDPEDVLQARLAVLDHIRRCGPGKLDGGQPWESGVLDSRCGQGCIPNMEGDRSVTHHEQVKRVLEGPRPTEFFRTLFGEEVKTFDYKWLRGVHRAAYTGAHVDAVYMGRGTDRLLTLWTPLDGVPVEMGTLAVVEASHTDPGYDHLQRTYGHCDIEREGLQGTGWFSHDPLEVTGRFGGQWKTADFEPGDALIFTIRTVHMSTANLTDKVRISCDTRWQPASEPIDARYATFTRDLSEKGLTFGLSAKDNLDPTAAKVTMAKLKLQWGFQ